MGSRSEDEAGSGTDGSALLCYGVLERVFPKTPAGLREVPPNCLACPKRKPCLQTALQTPHGLKMRLERLEQASGRGWRGWLRRWSEKKHLDRCIQQEKESGGGP